MSDEAAGAAREDAWRERVYEELRGLAGALMAGERADHTLEPTALVHEVWLRLADSRNAAALDRGAFLGTAAQAMRRILTDHARARGAARRGGGARRTTLAGKDRAHEPRAFVVEVDAALAELERHDPDLARLVELRFFAGLSTAELADSLGLSERTVKRRWRFARAWLHRRMEAPEEAWKASSS